MSVPRPQTPPSSNAEGSSAPAHKSSPIKAAKYHAEERSEFRQNVYQSAIHKPKKYSLEEFAAFLDKTGRIANNFTPPDCLENLAVDNFIPLANQLSAKVRHDYCPTQPLLVFNETGTKEPLGHVTDTDCKPDFAAGFDAHWTREEKPNIHWSRMELVGEKASKGTSKGDQELQATSYLHYLLLARPDLLVAQSILTAEDGVTFLLGIGGIGIRSLKVSWGQDLVKILYLSIYRLYKPEAFRDPSYVATKGRLKDEITYTMLAPGIECSGFRLIYSSHPFRGRTHVFSNPSSTFTVDGKPFSVIKEQLCRPKRYSEIDILGAIHRDGVVPGVVQTAWDEIVTSPFNEEEDGDMGRKKHRIGLRECGRPFMGILNVNTVLRVIYDLLEVLRYTRVKRNVLHRDISKNNVMYVLRDDGASDTSRDGGPINRDQVHGEDDPVSNSFSEDDGPANEAQDKVEDEDICFIGYLLGESSDRRKTEVLVIDYNHGEDLSAKTGPENTRTTITGTPCFMARAVEKNGSLPFVKSKVIPAIPPCPQARARHLPNRSGRFPERVRLIMDPTGHSPFFRHELDHDVESAFWLLFYWAILANPKLSSDPSSDNFMGPAWNSFKGDWDARSALLTFVHAQTLHSHFKPLSVLLCDLAEIIYPDRLWWPNPESDPRAHFEYAGEAFQRLLYRFIVDNSDAGFMKTTITPNRPRKAIQSSQHPSRAVTTAQSIATTSGGMNRPKASSGVKRPSSSLNEDENQKRRRTDNVTEGQDEKEEVEVDPIDT